MTGDSSFTGILIYFPKNNFPCHPYEEPPEGALPFLMQISVSIVLTSFHVTTGYIFSRKKLKIRFGRFE
jgi:hypothetical protein